MPRAVRRLMKYKRSIFSIIKLSVNHEAISQIFVLQLNTVLFILYMFMTGIL